jgi:hypothetical protein
LAESVLIIWGWLSFFDIVIKSTILYRVFHGKAGEDIRQEYIRTAEHCGGIFNYVAASVAVSIVLAPFAFTGSICAVCRLWRLLTYEVHSAVQATVSLTIPETTIGIITALATDPRTDNRTAATTEPFGDIPCGAIATSGEPPNSRLPIRRLTIEAGAYPRGRRSSSAQ